MSKNHPYVENCAKTISIHTLERVLSLLDFEKNGDAPGPLGDFVKSLVTERLFLFLPFS